MNAKIQEAAAVLSTIKFDPDRVNELTLADVETAAIGVMEIVGGDARRMSVKVSRALSALTQPTVEKVATFLEVALRERLVASALKPYAEGITDE